MSKRNSFGRLISSQEQRDRYSQNDLFGSSSAPVSQSSSLNSSQSSSLKSVATKSDQLVEGCDPATSVSEMSYGCGDGSFNIFLEEYTVQASLEAARFWDTMSESERAKYGYKDDFDNCSSDASIATEGGQFDDPASAMSGDMFGHGGGCERKKRMTCAKPKKRSCSKPKRRAAAKPRCPKPKPRAARRCAKPKAKARCPKPRSAKRCPKPRSAKRCPKPKPACPMHASYMKLEEPKKAQEPVAKDK